MIQRIQTVFLLFVVLIHVLLFFLPVYSVVSKPDKARSVQMDLKEFMYSEKQMNGKPVLNTLTLTLIGLDVAIASLAFIGIFLFRNRNRQLRLVRAVAGLAFIFLAGWFYAVLQAHNLAGQAGDVEESWQIGSWLPILTPVFLILAARGIRKDEELVRSADRLR